MAASIILPAIQAFPVHGTIPNTRALRFTLRGSADMPLMPCPCARVESLNNSVYLRNCVRLWEVVAHYVTIA